MSDYTFAEVNAKDFSKALDRLGKEIGDFRVVFRLISSHFYRSQRRIFALKSEGKYPPLGGFGWALIDSNGLSRRRNAEDRKERKTGRPWPPILYGVMGDLKESTLSNRHRYSIYYIDKKQLFIGTSVPYGKFHQSDKPRKKIPQRKFIYIDGGDQDTARDSSGQGRREAWLKIIDTHLEQVLKGSI